MKSPNDQSYIVPIFYFTSSFATLSGFLDGKKTRKGRKRLISKTKRSLKNLPSRKEFLALRGKVFKYRQRPVPVVLRRIAFSAQLTACVLRKTRKKKENASSDITGSLFGGGVSTSRAGLLLEMERSATATHTQTVCLLMAFTKTGRSLCLLNQEKRGQRTDAEGAHARKNEIHG